MLRIRSLIENSEERALDSLDIELQREAYGQYYWKCPVFSCPNFQQGFLSSAERASHMKVHTRDFKCPHGECGFHTTGFTTQKALESHLSCFHEAISIPYRFPQLEPRSPWKDLEEAIDDDDAGTVQELCPDVLNLPNLPQLLLRAVKKGSFACARILAQYPEFSTELGQGRDRRLKDSALCLAASKGESELTSSLLSHIADHDVPEQFWNQAFSDAVCAQHIDVLNVITHRQLASSRSKLLSVTWTDWRQSFLNGQYPAQYEVIALLVKNLEAVSLEPCHIERICLQAAKTGNTRAVRDILELAERTDFLGRRDYTKALTKAKKKGIDAMVDLIIAQGGGAVDSHGKTFGNALQYAALKGDDKKVLELLKNGADINHSDSAYGTALQAAASKGSEATVRLLLDQGADAVMSTRAKCGNALSEAASKGHCHVMRILLSKGVDLSARAPETWDRGVRGGTPLHMAAFGVQRDAVALLLDSGADCSATDLDQRTVLHVLMAGGGRAEFHYGSKKNRDLEECATASAEILLAHGADIMAKDFDGNTPLQTLWLSFNMEDKSATVLVALTQMLLQRGADMRAKNHAGQDIRDIASTSYVQILKDAIQIIDPPKADEDDHAG